MNRSRSRSEAAAERGRWSSRRKTDVVLRILRGEALDALSRTGRDRHGAGPPARPWQPVPERSVPGRAALPGHRQQPGLRAEAGGQRLCRALHSHAQRTAPLGGAVRHRRGSPPGPARLPGTLQPRVADRAAWPPLLGRCPGGLRRGGRRMIIICRVSGKSGAQQHCDGHHCLGHRPQARRRPARYAARGARATDSHFARASHPLTGQVSRYDCSSSTQTVADSWHGQDVDWMLRVGLYLPA